jgi:hypothetical protein
MLTAGNVYSIKKLPLKNDDPPVVPFQIMVQVSPEIFCQYLGLHYLLS